MPRESAASLTVLPVSSLARVEAPACLEEGERDLFVAVVNSKPADWFGEDSVPLLVEYVRACGMCDLLDYQVKAAIAEGDAKVIKSAMVLRDMESKRALTIATKLRLTQQSRYTPQAAATAVKGAGTARPWLRQQR